MEVLAMLTYISRHMATVVDFIGFGIRRESLQLQFVNNI